MSSTALIDIDITSEMAAPAAWTPGRFLTNGDATVIDVNSPVYDPVRGQRSNIFGGMGHTSQDLSYMSEQGLHKCSSLPRGTTYLIMACCVVASLSLGLLAYIHL
ncbi:uncharacterized protein LOC124256086 [Haliotis rubra]|uniref:uncharacterized protein LOC124256086 n=1 Tax=Haliotis rubra TaxID=36100 RepID=UPI001EE62C68|nr:uncharacterized protein LOC124256086 [Haliotis rubra]